MNEVVGGGLIGLYVGLTTAWIGELSGWNLQRKWLTAGAMSAIVAVGLHLLRGSGR